MKLDKYKISNGKFGFFALCFFFIVCILIMTKISDLFVDSVEIEAVVTNTYLDYRGKGNPRPKMNIEWTDLEGDIQTEGNMYNEYNLEEGDTCIILVDKETHSKITNSATGSIILFFIGLIGLIIDLIFMKFLYGFERY